MQTLSLNEKEKADQTFLGKLEERLFQLFYQFLKDIKITTPQYFFLCLFEFFTLSSFSFHSLASFPWYPDKLYSNLLKWINLFRITYLVEMIDGTLFVYIFFMVGIFTVFLFFFFVCIIYNTDDAKLSLWIKRFVMVILTIFPNVLYMVLIETFGGVLDCEEIEGTKYIASTRDYSSRIECFTTFHICMVGFSLVLIILSAIINLTSILFFFEAKLVSQNKSAKKDPIQDLVCFISKTLIVLAFALYNGAENQVLLGGILLIFSTINLYYAFFKLSYHEPAVRKIRLIFFGIWEWTNILLFAQLLLEESFSKINAVLVILLSPIFGSVLVFKAKDSFKYVTVLDNSITSPESHFFKIRELLYIHTLSDQKEYSIKLKGSYLSHIERCHNPTCPINNEAKQLILYDDMDIISLKKKQKLLFNFIEISFQRALMYHPESTLLLIYYTCFLLEFLKDYPLALTQIQKAETTNTSFVFKFPIYRYKKMLETRIIEERLKSHICNNIEHAVQSETLINALKKNMYLAAISFYELWNNIKGGESNMQIIEKNCYKIIAINSLVERNWKMLTQIGGETPKALSFYSLFHLKVLNDIKSSVIYLQRSKTEEILRGQTFQHNSKDMRNIKEYSSNGTPCIYISAIPENLGMITNSNLSACQLFGYPKNVLLGQNVKMLMPIMIRRHHKNCLLQANQNDAGYFNKKRDVFSFGKHVSGYIFPIILTIRKVISFTSIEDQYVALISFPKHNLYSVEQPSYILINNQFIIKEISQNCVHRFNLYDKLIREEDFSITKIVPGFNKWFGKGRFKKADDSKEGILSIHQPLIKKEGVTTTVDTEAKITAEVQKDDNLTLYANIRRMQQKRKDSFEVKQNDSSDDETNSSVSVESLERSVHSQYIMETSDMVDDFICSLSPIRMNDIGVLGYAFKISDRQRDAHLFEQAEKTFPRKIGEPQFEFIFNQEMNKFNRNIRDDNQVKDFSKRAGVRSIIFDTPKSTNVGEIEVSIDELIDLASILKYWRKTERLNDSKSFYRKILKNKLLVLQASINNAFEKMAKLAELKNIDIKKDEIESSYFSVEFLERIKKQQIWDHQISSYIISEDFVFALQGEFRDDPPSPVFEESTESVSALKEMNRSDDDSSEAIKRKKKIQKQDSSLTIDSKETLNEIIEGQKKIPLLGYFFIFVMNISLFGLITMSISSSIFETQYFKDLGDCIGVIDAQIKKNCEFMYIKESIRSIILMNEEWKEITETTGLQTSQQTIEALFNERKTQMNESYYNIKQLQNYITLSDLDNQEGIVTNKDIDSTATVEILIEEGIAEKQYKVLQSYDQIMAALYAIIQFDIDEFQSDNSQIHFFIENTFNREGNYLNESLENRNHLNTVSDEISQKLNYLNLLILIVAIGFLGMFFAVSLWIKLKMRKTERIVLSFFIQIPFKSLDEISKNCEDFLSTYRYQMENKDDEGTNTSLFSEVLSKGSTNSGGSIDENSGSIYQRRKFKQRLLEESNFYVICLILKLIMNVIIMLVFNIVVFVVIQQYDSTIFKISDRLETSLELEFHLIQFFSLMKESFHSDYGSSELSEIYDQILTNIEDNRGYIKEFEKLHELEDIDQSLYDNYNRYLLKNLCDYSYIETCEEQSLGINQLGLLSTIAYFSREGIELYALFLNNRGDPTTLNTNVYHSTMITELKILIYDYIKPMIRSIGSKNLDIIDNKISNLQAYVYGIMVAFIIIGGLAYLFFIIPYTNALKNELWKIHYSLTFIPLDIIVNNNKLIEYLSKLNRG